MSTVNAVTIYAENLQGANLIVGNTSSNLTVTANSIAISVGNVTVNSTAIKIVSFASASQNTTINATALTANTLKLNGTDYNGIIGDTVLVDYQVFTNPLVANFWYKPAWAQANDIVTIQMWGGGGGGFTNTVAGGAGGGGACVIANKLAGECNSVCNVVVGAAGAGGNTTNASTAGGNTVFWSNSTVSITAYGGNNGLGSGGGGGGWFSTANSTNGGGGPIGGASGSSGGTSTFGGGGAGTSGTGTGGDSVYGGGGGAAASTGRGGISLYGGGGGTFNGTLGTSTFGGNGGNVTIAATAPGGGGACLGSTINTTNITAMNGARGEVRVWVTGQARAAGDALPYYFITPNTSTLYEGNSISFSVTALNVANGTTVYYTLNNSSTATSADFTTAVNGSVVINGGVNSFTLTAAANGDVLENFYMDLRTSSTSGTIVANSQSVNVVTTAFDYVTYANTGTPGSASALTVYANNISIGVAAPNRLVVLTIGAELSSETYDTTVTVNGLAATRAARAYYSSPYYLNEHSIWAVELPTGTTANVAISNDGSFYNTIVSTYVLYGYNATPNQIKEDQFSNSYPWVFTTNVGDVIIATALGYTNASWTSSNLTMDNKVLMYNGANSALARYSYSGSNTANSNGTLSVTISAPGYGATYASAALWRKI